MKMITIGSTERHMGKTTLARRLRRTIPNSIVLKIGHHADKQKTEPLFHHPEALLDALKTYEQTHDVVIIESNAVLRHIKPDVAIFIKGKSSPMKISAVLASTMADIIIDDGSALVSSDMAEKLATLFAKGQVPLDAIHCVEILMRFQDEFRRWQSLPG